MKAKSHRRRGSFQLLDDSGDSRDVASTIAATQPLASGPSGTGLALYGVGEGEESVEHASPGKVSSDQFRSALSAVLPSSSEQAEGQKTEGYATEFDPSAGPGGGGESRKPEIRIRHSIHDRFQIESDITFDLRPRGPFESRRKFKVDMYLYLPFSMGVNPSNFNGSEFFRHWTSYFRVRAPLFQQWRVLPPELLSFPSVDAYFAGHLSSQQRLKLGPRVVQDVKLFGNFLYTELKKLRSALPKKKRSRDAERRKYLADELLHRVALLWSFRKICLQPLREGRYLVDEEVQRAFYLTDEYLSYRAELVLLRARDSLSEHAEELGEMLAREISYRHEHGLLVLSEDEQAPATLEAYTYRLGLLKKYLGEALFLNTISDKKDNLYKNYAAATGAGLAAFFAGIVETQRMQYLQGDGSAVRFSFLITLMVLAYIFKDRIKELSRDYFNTRLRERLPDQRFRLMHQSVAPNGKQTESELGISTEYFRFVKDVPADVDYLRSLGQTKNHDPVRREHVVHVARRFDFQVITEPRTLFPLLKNVVRLDISPFLSKLDNPTMPVSFYDNNRNAKTVIAPKVYHMNVVFRYETLFGPEGSLVKVDYERVRVILDKNGIVRLETLLESGRLAYQEVPS
jgi:hypothetical protein